MNRLIGSNLRSRVFVCFAKRLATALMILVSAAVYGADNYSEVVTSPKWILRAISPQKDINAILIDDTPIFDRYGSLNCYGRKGDVLKIRSWDGTNGYDGKRGPDNTLYASPFSDGCFNGEGWVPERSVRRVNPADLIEYVKSVWPPVDRPAQLKKSESTYSLPGLGKGWRRPYYLDKHKNPTIHIVRSTRDKRWYYVVNNKDYGGVYGWLPATAVHLLPSKQEVEEKNRQQK
jgi:hypothetical protein